MTLSNPTATALRNFLNRLGSGNEKHLAKVISENFSIVEHSIEFHSLLFSETRNFSRLRYQIEASDFRPTAKRNYLSQIESLSMVTRYDFLGQRFDHVKKNFIDANLVVLGYLEDSLRVGQELTVEAIAELTGVADQLIQLRGELVHSSLPVGVLASLQEQLDELIFSLRNYACIGPVSTWRQASATAATIYKDAHVASTPQSQALLGKVGAALALVIGTVVAADTTLGHIESIIERSIKIGGHIKSGYESIEKWKPPVPQIEYKPKLPNSDITDV